MVRASEAFPLWDESLDLSEILTGGPRKLLESYSHIPPSDVESHVRAIAKKGWDIRDYPCFRMFWFLDFDLSRSPQYARVLELLKSGALFIDIGCGIGQDIRRLVYDGVPGQNLIGLDLYGGFVDLGFELFRDKASLGASFLIQSFFDDTALFRQVMGQVSVVNSGYFMHLWDWDGQIKIGRRMMELLPTAGGLVTGVHFGSKRSGRWIPHGGKEMFLHDTDTLTAMWTEIGEMSGVRLDVEAVSQEDVKCKYYDPDGFIIRWVVQVESRAN
ncbi:hypothetical protein BDV32DRAFT_134646 [Aspergillus pseudonomiae]|uniref:Uncharacterized protein n=1 Tax=Aspergillus pseudonomiae TaxID=1506151 RepID=A0A5N7D7Y2_9EURO|nr:uncharacterized protein BDV37DRAFT_272889 [Aspergillus pseudonomiae]KAB8265373.1 hypothetical protein BDV32DRAFT_134646 [Aspergillus pseudonomiae]KAE8402424.1 hypothetical protein BDV37DRAFT_272889 [Aspergillus pseudonomiae]